MKFSLEMNGVVNEVRTENDDIDVFKMFEMFRTLFIGATFANGSFADGCKYMLEEFYPETLKEESGWKVE